jgi:hypothetical protein
MLILGPSFDVMLCPFFDTYKQFERKKEKKDVKAL